MLINMINLGSSSAGNCYFLKIKRDNYKEPFGLMIECGFTYKEILLKMAMNGISMEDVDAVLISHEHEDHAKGVKEIIEYSGKRVYAPKEVFQKYDVSGGIELKERYVKAIADGIVVKPFALEHINSDEVGSNVVNLGYIITVNNRYNALFVVDTMYLKYKLNEYKFDDIFIEANYLSQQTYIAYEHAKKHQDYGNIKRYGRVLHSHMSVETCIKTLNNLDLSETNNIFIIHASSGDLTNYLKYKQKIEAKTNLGERTRVVICKKDGGFQL